MWILFLLFKGRQVSESKEEADIIANVIAGDTQAFRLLVVRYQNVIYSYFMRQIGDMHKAQDLSQEVFLKAYRSIRTFKGQSTFLTWLYKIAINHNSTYLSSKEFRQRKLSTLLDVNSNKADSYVVHNVIESYQNELLLRKLKSAVQGLKPIYRDVVVLCCFESKTYDETASILGIPFGTVCSRMNKALSTLRVELSKEFV